MGKKKSRSKPQDLVSLEATAHKLQSLLTAPDYMGFVQSGSLQGVREKLVRINFMTIRNVVDRIPLLNAIINAQIDHVRQFCHYTIEKNTPGFTLVKADGSKVEESDEAIRKQLVEFIEQTGFNYDDQREDDYSDYAAMFTREVLVIDQIATEIQRNRKGESVAFWLLDGSYIKRVNPNNSRFNKNVRYVQQIEDKIYNQYTSEDLIFDYKNMRADLRFRGYGYSITEQCIDLITTLLFGYNYVRDQLLRDRIPKGFLQVMGDIGQTQLDSIRRYWYAAMSGAGGQWNIPILPSGKDGVGIDFKAMGQSNRDMEYHKLMMFLSSVVAAVAGMDLAELGIKADDSQAIIGESSKGRTDTSRSRWLRALLMFLEQHTNKVLRKVTTDWRLQFVGIDREDELNKANIRKAELESRLTINELRKQAGDPPLEGEGYDYCNHILNPQAIQLIMADKQNAMAGDIGGDGAPGEGDGMFDDEFQDPSTWDPDNEDTGDGEDKESVYDDEFQDPKDFMKSRPEEKVVRIIIQ